MAGDAIPIGASGINPQNLYQPMDRTKPASEQLLAPASIRRYEAHQWRYINELSSGLALTTTDVGYGTTSENKSLEVSEEAEEASKGALAKALNALIAHGMLLGINTSLSTSSNWTLKEISPNTVGIAPDGNHYGQKNPIFDYFGDQKTFRVVSEYTTSKANLSITLPTIIGVNSSIQVQNPDGSTTMSLTQNKTYSFRTYFNGTTPKIVIENADLVIEETPSASETVSGVLKISTTAQVTEGVDNTSAITPAKLHEHLNNVKEVSVTVSGSGTNATGYTIFKDISTGAIVRKVVWGRHNTISSNNGRNITFPITFTTIQSALVSIIQNGGSTDVTPDSPSHSRDLSLTGIRLCNSDNLQTVDLSIQITGV